MKIKIKVKGIAPLIMHKFVPTEGTASRGKKVYIPEDEAEKVAYKDEKGKLVLPTTHFKASMVKSAVDFPAKGKKSYKDYIKAGLLMLETETKITPNKYEVYTCPVVVNRARIARSRPLFKNWSCEFTLEIITAS